MSINQLLATLTAQNVQLALKDGQLVVQGNRQALTDSTLVAQLRAHKPTLVGMLERGEYVAVKQGAVQVPGNLIAPGCTHITPQLLNLVTLDQASLDSVVSAIPGARPTCRTSIHWRRCNKACSSTTPVPASMTRT